MRLVYQFQHRGNKTEKMLQLNCSVFYGVLNCLLISSRLNSACWGGFNLISLHLEKEICGLLRYNSKYSVFLSLTYSFHKISKIRVLVKQNPPEELFSTYVMYQLFGDFGIVVCQLVNCHTFSVISLSFSLISFAVVKSLFSRASFMDS